MAEKKNKRKKWPVAVGIAGVVVVAAAAGVYVVSEKGGKTDSTAKLTTETVTSGSISVVTEGSGSVTLLISLVQGGTGSITASMDDLGGNQIIANITDRHKKLTYHELESLKGSGGIAEVSPYLSGMAVGKASGKSTDVTVYGITAAYTVHYHQKYQKNMQKHSIEKNGACI